MSWHDGYCLYDGPPGGAPAEGAETVGGLSAELVAARAEIRRLREARRVLVERLVDIQKNFPADSYLVHRVVETLEHPDVVATAPGEEKQGKNCERCGGKGWYEDTGSAHAWDCDGSCRNCPVAEQIQVQCAACGGSGKRAG